MKIVAISGMVGTGKTTLCDALAKKAGWSVVREDVTRNAFLPFFYDDMERWALASQLSFMLNKTKEFEAAKAKKPEVILVDRTLQEDLFVFCAVLRKYQILSPVEYTLLEEVYEHLVPCWKPYDFSLYLEDTDENCFQRLLNRGHAYESKIELGYVQSIGREYKDWKKKFIRAPFYQLNSSMLDFREDRVVTNILDTVRVMMTDNSSFKP